MKFDKALNLFYKEQLLRGNQVATIKAYKSHLKVFQEYCCNCDLECLSYEMYCDYIIYLTNSKNISSISRYDYAKDLKIVLKFFYKKKLIQNNIAANIEKLPKFNYLIPRIISVDCIVNMLNNFDMTNVLDVRNALIIALCFDCGLRLSELIRLQVNDFDLENLIIRVTGKWNKQRNVPLTWSVADFYIKYLNFNYRLSGQLLLDLKNNPITKEAIRSLFRKLKKKYQLQEFYPHLLRHSFATLFLLNGGDALVLQEILGHTTLEMTKKYVHIANSINIAKSNVYSPLSFNMQKANQKMISSSHSVIIHHNYKR